MEQGRPIHPLKANHQFLVKLYTQQSSKMNMTKCQCTTAQIMQQTCIKNVPPSFQDTFTPRSVHHNAMLATIMNKIVCIKEQVQVFCGLSQEERLHTIFLPMISYIFNLQQHAIHTMTKNTKKFRLTDPTATLATQYLANFHSLDFIHYPLLIMSYTFVARDKQVVL